MANKSVTDLTSEETLSPNSLDDALDGKKETAVSKKVFNFEIRHKIESRVEDQKLIEELNEYEFFDLEDTDTLH